MIVETKIQMRFADVDRLGHVNNVNIMHYFDVGKDEFLSRTMNTKVGFKEHSIINAATHASYFEQIKPGENIAVRTSLIKIGTKSFTLLQEIVNTDTQTVKSRSECIMVMFDFCAQRSIIIPHDWRERMEQILVRG